MRRTRFFLWLPIAAVAAVVWTSCAPVDDSPSREQIPSEPRAVGDPTPVKPRALRAMSGGVMDRVEAALRHVWQRDLLTTHGFWTVFHGILGMGFETTLLDPLTREKVNAIDHIAAGGELRGLEFIPTKEGLDVRTGPQFVGQGHQDQFIAEMAQWGMPADRKFVVLGKDYTFMDFVRHTQFRASTQGNQELSWAILIVAQYISTDVAWTNSSGEKLHFEDVVRYELKESIENAACGGTHRLFGLTWAYYLHLRKGGKTEGVWKDVADKLDRYKKLARKYQNSDGSFSSKYLAGPGNSPSTQERIGTTGHVLEWLALALSAEELREPWVQDAAGALALMILDSQNSPVEGGALYHATHGLHIYHDRVFGPMPDHKPPLIPLPPGEELPTAPPAGSSPKHGR